MTFNGGMGHILAELTIESMNKLFELHAKLYYPFGLVRMPGKLNVCKVILCASDTSSRSILLSSFHDDYIAKSSHFLKYLDYSVHYSARKCN